ncbi:MAG: LysR family transcriptional regulator [Moritella sp.]|uniref:LysR family transcriptional regulator n=1 Tax=Moritella sp. TaxID=78556 RepID=UPI0029AD811D|nr:LysR family transcriptional regulator [Moritella sp.]MDX2320886.1 LysR family transcriptional regulator [Moritella sp.]
MNKFECMQVFVQVAKVGSFTAAADALNVTQSSVSKKIAWLEQNINITLFYRNSRKVSLTEQGKPYALYCEKLLDEMQHTESQLKGELAQVSGELKLSVPSAFAYHMLTQPVSQFMRLHPNLVVNMSVNDQHVDLFRSDVDIAIRASDLKDSGLKARFLLQHQVAYFASPEYINKAGKPNLPSDLSAHHCISYSLMPPSNIWQVLNLNGEVENIKISEAFKSDCPNMILAMALQGHGIAALPIWMVTEHFSQGRLIPLLENYPPRTLPMYALYKQSDYLPSRIRSFIDFIVQYFAQSES